jgi:hypothetical protein
MKAFRSLPNAAPRSHRRFEHPGMPGEGSFLQMPSSGSKLASEVGHLADVGLLPLADFRWPGVRDQIEKLGVGES